jgi:protein phosphatase
LSLCFAARTDIGRKRKTNEDFFAVDEVRRLFVVADGLGGHVAGRTASEIASYRFCEAVRLSQEPRAIDAVRRAFHAAHQAIRERVEQQPELAGMGTTLVSLWFHGETAILGHVGDSRMYLMRGDTLYLITHDHSLVSEMVFRGQLTPEGARTHPHRHVITRALGVGSIMEPDTAEFRLQPGDVFALCTDGISSAIEDAEILEQIQEAKGDLGIAADSLIQRANKLGGDDNATIVLASI